MVRDLPLSLIGVDFTRDSRPMFTRDDRAMFTRDVRTMFTSVRKSLLTQRKKRKKEMERIHMNLYKEIIYRLRSGESERNIS